MLSQLLSICSSTGFCVCHNHHAFHLQTCSAPEPMLTLAFAAPCNAQFQCIAVPFVKKHWFLFFLNRPLWLQADLYSSMSLPTHLSNLGWSAPAYLGVPRAEAAPYPCHQPLTRFRCQERNGTWCQNHQFCRSPGGWRSCAPSRWRRRRVSVPLSRSLRRQPARAVLWLSLGPVWLWYRASARRRKDRPTVTAPKHYPVPCLKGLRALQYLLVL